ncbi:glyoxalase/bleomycin resistance/extradiol dioxygenase family protein [Streptomyces sp. WAC 01529]|uniref:bleomycin resistance protein n=1 Tax=Streptomyces sp. WAC 01529 TaxID=2203205 RepID=UPI000F6E12A0|nr:VOC family protein [Streptomyces sp. WAC 01529]AZM52350.1 glyoxalase/bleomycin resistance/extradiol dioxygenase family protein [Streptomyces sp. WAC 01529]
MAEKTIPLLPCRTVQPVVDFYTALGFETTFFQKSPYPYAVVERGAIELQFFGMKEYDPKESYSGCYVVTDDVERLHTAFRAGLKAAYGKIPSRGLPRIGPLKDMSYGMRQFLMTDPGGNGIRVGQPISEDQTHRPAPKGTFARALHMADLFADSKEDLPGAAKIIDRVLGLTDEKPTPEQELRLLILRGDIAQRLGDDALADRLLTRAAQLRLTDEERKAAHDALTRLAELTA